MEYGHEDRRPRRLMGEDEFTGIDFFSGDEVDVDDMIDLEVRLKAQIDGLEKDRFYSETKESTADEKKYVLGEIKDGIYISETDVLSERDAKAIMELLPDEYMYIRPSE